MSAMDDSSFPIGAQVILVDLAKTPQYNGRSGVVKSPLVDERQHVLLEDGNTLSIKPENLLQQDDNAVVLPHGLDIAKILTSKGPIVKCVLLRAVAASNDDIDDEQEQKPAAKQSREEEPEERVILTDLIDEIEMDTTPKKSMVSKILGGSFTFVGQYEDEEIVLMARRPDEAQDLPLNPHYLQPPLTDSEVRGDILVIKVAPTEEVLDQEDDNEEIKPVVVPTNDEFFLDYTKDEYIHFAKRTDVVVPEVDEGDYEEEEETDDDDDEEEEYKVEDDDKDDDDDDAEAQVAMMNLIMGQVLRRFREEKGRGPDTTELLELRSAVASKLGVQVPAVEDAADWNEKAPKKASSPQRPTVTQKRTNDQDEDTPDQKSGGEQDAKRVKFSQSTEQEESKEARKRQEETSYV